MKYLMLIKHDERFRNESMPPEFMDVVGTWVTDSMRSGIIKETAGLKPTSEGVRIRTRGGKLHVTDGPFTETKEIIGGYAMIEAASKEEAIAFAEKFMDMHREHWPAFEGECEVRELENQ
jgi:hypothetical protein